MNAHVLKAVRCVLSLTFLLAATAAIAQPRFTVDEMLKLKRVSDPQVSPDGRWVAYVVTEVNQEANTRDNQIWIVSIDGGEPVRFVASEGSDDRPRWSPDGTRLAYVSSRKDGAQIYARPVLVQPKTKTIKPGTESKLTALATEASGHIWSPDGRSLVFVSAVFSDCDSIECNAKRLQAQQESKVKARVLTELMFRHWTAWRDGRYNHLFIIPSERTTERMGRPRDLTPGAADVPPFSLGGPEDYAFSPDSQEIAFVRKTDPVEAVSTNSDLFVVGVDPASETQKLTPNPAADGGPSYSPDGRFLLYRAQQRAGAESDRWQLMLRDRHAGTTRSLTPTFDRSPDEYVWAPDSRTVYFSAEDRAKSVIFRLDIEQPEPRPIVAEAANMELRLSRDGQTLVFSRSSTHAPADIFRATADGTAVTALTKTNEKLMAAFKLRPAEAVTYNGAGDTPIHALIVKPADFQEGRRYPLIFLVHGGPQGVFGDVWSYRWNSQVLAADGYVVFMPNPRGSTSFGQQFTDEITGDWAGKVYEDLMKGADYAEALPYVERGRTGAAGASYGGYMMNWFLGHTDRFKALVSHAGVYNLESMYGVTEELWFPEWELRGVPWTNPEMYQKVSPHKFAKNFKTPTLVTHGEIDFRVPIGEGLQLFTTLQRLGVPSKMVYFPDEGHWIGKPQNAALWYREFLGWMARWVRGDAGAATR